VNAIGVGVDWKWRADNTATLAYYDNKDKLNSGDHTRNVVISNDFALRKDTTIYVQTAFVDADSAATIKTSIVAAGIPSVGHARRCSTPASTSRSETACAWTPGRACLPAPLPDRRSAPYSTRNPHETCPVPVPPAARRRRPCGRRCAPRLRRPRQLAAVPPQLQRLALQPAHPDQQANVKKLKVAWIHQPGNITHGLQATPIVLDGVLYYISADNNVWAVDAATGKTIWHYTAKLNPIAKQAFYASASRGVTVGRGKVFVGTSTGASSPSTRRPARSCGPPSSPTQDPVRRAVLVAAAAGRRRALRRHHRRRPAHRRQDLRGECRHRQARLDLRHQERPGQLARRQRQGGRRLGVDAGTYDESTDTIYIGTSNAAPDYYTPGREGDNKYIDPARHRPQDRQAQVAPPGDPHDTWDFDAAYEALLVKKDGKDVIVHLNKSGFVFVMDKQDGSLENVWQFAENMNWAKGIDPKTGALIEPRRPQPGKRELLCPNLLGARSWNHGAYNPGTGLWYSHAMEVCNEVVSGKDDPANLTAISALSLGIDEIKLVPPPSGKKPDGRLDARDPLTGKIKWSIRYELPPSPACSPPAAGWCSPATWKAACSPTTPTTARSCGASTPAPACAAAR
jgi:alcohol dehydrogenase (cytochrome c)